MLNLHLADRYPPPTVDSLQVDNNYFVWNTSDLILYSEIRYFAQWFVNRDAWNEHELMEVLISGE